MEADTLLSCDDFARFALDDEDANVRSRAISLLWECEDPKLAGRFAEMLSNDPSDIVRAAAASALGKFVLMGELEEISRKVFSETIDLLLQVYTSELSERVRQEILRSLSYSGQRDITIMIQEAFLSDKKDWKIAALESMGRSADNRWKDHVISTLDHSDEDYQYEAIRAAGELELKPARLSLLEMLMEDEIANSDLRFQVIWALSKIGGESVYETLQELLDNAEDDDEIDVLELALENLEFTDDNTSLDII
jgi:HEAT repeat protein